MIRQQTPFMAHWLGKCPVKGCHCRLHIDVPMIRETWKETYHDHARGFSWEQSKQREFPDHSLGQHWTPWHLGLHCSAHKRELAWTPINGHYSAEHVCDSRCMNATGPNCECGCGGENHGRGYHVELAWKPENASLGKFNNKTL